MNNNELILGGILVSGVIMSLVQIIKGLGMPAKFAPYLSVGIGLGFGVLAYCFAPTDKSLILQGLVSGLIASGFYSNIKEGVNLVKGK